MGHLWYWDGQSLSNISEASGMFQLLIRRMIDCELNMCQLICNASTRV